MSILEESVVGLRSQLAQFALAGRSVGLVPTMGSLHRGHVFLIEQALEQCDEVVVSLFVNPLQFTERDDFVNYPKDLDADRLLVEGLGVSILFAPTVDEIYPSGAAEVTVDPGPLASVLEGASRPGHFRGVATVVAKLFSMVNPQRAYFGEKDYQQLVIVKKMTADLSFGLEVVAAETVRDDDGCALSSRNARLSANERAAAAVLSRCLRAGAQQIKEGELSPRAVQAHMASVVADEPLASLDYAVVRDAASLGELEVCTGSMRLLVAARIGSVRLIDNLGVVA